MKKLFLLAMVIGILISGCASKEWTRKDDYSQRQFNIDSVACETEANSLVSGGWVWIIPYAGIFVGTVNHSKKVNYYERCLQNKGYEIVPK